MRLAVILPFLLAGVADASPPPPPDEEPAGRPALEWSTWFRIGFGMQPADAAVAARATTPPPPAGQVTTWDAALGIDLTGAITQSENVRIGPWLEIRGLSMVGGAELVIQRVPRTMNMFFYEGQGVLVMRAGGNHERATGQVAYGYLAPWNLFRPDRGTSRYMIGVRFVATYTRALDDARDWSATIGLETEPIGALRYLLGIRSWY